MVTTIESKGIKAEAIINTVNKYFNLDCRELGRPTEIVVARQMAMYYIRKEIKLSHGKIGKLFPSEDSASGFKGHATVIYSCKTISDLIEVDAETRKYDNDLSEDIELIAKLDLNEITQYKIRADIFEKLKELSEGQLNNVNTYLERYFLNKVA
jgi:chromosomal replication initiation ATPase DnaA